LELIETDDREHDIAANTQQYMDAIERYVAAFPEQYLWMLPRWRTRPDGTSWTAHTPVDQMVAERVRPPLRPTFGYLEERPWPAKEFAWDEEATHSCTTDQ
jgi:hypothetical protein